jgi:hypothetical protein
MRIGYFDCFSGAAGDMILGALVDAGTPVELFQQIISRLGLPEVSLTVEKVKRHGLAATHVRVHVDPSAPKKHRHLSHIVRIIDAAALPEPVARRAKAVFTRLAEAEAQVHATTVEKVHFHEVGAADAIVDIVCACAGVEQLNLERILCSPIPTGSGTLTCDHGVMPVPAPATALLLRGAPLADCDEPGELTTPTGAAILTTMASGFGRLPPMRLTRIGCGAGTREGRTRPNILRLLVGESEAAATAAETVVVLEAQVDDMTGQAVAFATERLLESGALDAYVVPIIMKKGRPGQLLTALARVEDASAIEELVLTQTSTLGVRRRLCERRLLDRAIQTVQTRFGPIGVKVGQRDGRPVHAWPEYDDCSAAARASGVALSVVQQEALRAWSQGERGGG